MSWSLLNQSINQTPSRTLLTGLTTWLVACILYVAGGQGIHGFALVLAAGVVVGTYSSIYIASPALMWLGGRKLTGERQGKSSPGAVPAKGLTVSDPAVRSLGASSPANRGRTRKGNGRPERPDTRAV